MIATPIVTGTTERSAPQNAPRWALRCPALV